jgi:hypothetical protein
MCENTIFLAAQLETLRTQAANGGEIDMGSFTQQLNALSGLLSKLGLERKTKAAVHNLQTYVQSKSG